MKFRGTGWDSSLSSSFSSWKKKKIYFYELRKGTRDALDAYEIMKHNKIVSTISLWDVYGPTDYL